MKKLIYIIFLSLLLTGCNPDRKTDDLSYKEVKVESMDQEVKNFFQGAKNENGIYLYHDSEKRFVFLNSYLVEQENNASYFSDFDIKDEVDTIGIYFKEHSTDEYMNKNLRNQVFYEVDLDKKYKFIKLYKNDEETYFSQISGS